MHIFLTGEIQIGKTTVIQKTLKALDVPIGGFITYFGEDRFEENKELYMNAAWLPKEYKKSLSIATFLKGEMPLPNYSAFNLAGVNWIRAKSPRITWARVLTSKVLAMPGTPSISAWVPVKMEINARSTTWS